MTTPYAMPERRAPMRAGRATADGDVLVPIRGGLLASAVLVAVAATALAVIGFTGSYRSVRDLALEWGWGWFAYAFPIGIDVGIVGLIAADLFLCAIRTPAPILRWFAWTLTVATVVFNAASGWPKQGSAGWGDIIEAAAHATMPGLVVVITEALRRAIARRARIVDGRAFEPLGMARWLLAPFQTFAMWRRMRLWGIRSYDEALDLERDRLTLRDELREKYGRHWKRRASAADLRALRDANRGLPIPEHLIANASRPAAHTTAYDRTGTTANTANTANAAEDTANEVSGTARVPAQAFADAPPTANPTANGGFVDRTTPRTAGDPEREPTAYATVEPAGSSAAELGNSHRERSAVPAATTSRTLARGTVTAPYTPNANGAAADREPVTANSAAHVFGGTANAAVHGAETTAYGANGDREGKTTTALGDDRERSADRHAEARAERRRLAVGFLQAREAEQPALSQAEFARRAGVSPTTMTKALQEWREEHGG